MLISLVEIVFHENPKSACAISNNTDAEMGHVLWILLAIPVSYQGAGFK